VKRQIIILAVLCGVVAALLFGLVDVIPPRALTLTRMYVLKRRVLLYAQSHNELPQSLEVLPEMEGYDNSIRDAWNRNILFEVPASGAVTFRSLGRDGLNGGNGEDADIIKSFPVRNAQEKWSDEFVEWSKTSEHK
jgi:hypothetical protein